MWDALTGKSRSGRSVLIQQGGALSLVKGNLKYIEPRKGPAVLAETGIESGSSAEPQLYDLIKDPGEKSNVAGKYPDKVKELSALLQKIEADGRSRQ
jgi:arylsulfatase A